TDSGTCQSTSGSTLSPGTYCSGLSLSGTVNLSPGTYYIKGGNFKVNAKAVVTAPGVTIYLSGDSRVSMNGTAKVNMSAPTSGDYSGMLFFGDRKKPGTTKNIFNGTADSALTGAIYFANQTIQFNGDF